MKRTALFRPDIWPCCTLSRASAAWWACPCGAGAVAPPRSPTLAPRSRQEHSTPAIFAMVNISDTWLFWSWNTGLRILIHDGSDPAINNKSGVQIWVAKITESNWIRIRITTWNQSSFPFSFLLSSKLLHNFLLIKINRLQVQHKPVFRIRGDILRRIRILWSVHWIKEPAPALLVSGFQDNKKLFFLLQSFLLIRYLRVRVDTFTLPVVFKDNKSWRSRKPVEIKVFLHHFACSWKNQEPEDPEPDSWGPKTYESGTLT